MLTIEHVRAQVARVEHEVDGIAFRWNVTKAWEGNVSYYGSARSGPEHVGYFVQIEYDEVDDPYGPLATQQGRRWFVGSGVSPDEVLQTCLKAALASAEHRTREWFLVDGQRVYGPHQAVSERAMAGRMAEVSEGLRALARSVFARQDGPDGGRAHADALDAMADRLLDAAGAEDETRA